MAPKTRKALVRETLGNLRKSQFEAFVEALLDRREEPRVKCTDVEDQGFLKVTNVVVSTFTEQKAPQVVAEILREIGCGEEAEKLGKLTVSGAEQKRVVRTSLKSSSLLIYQGKYHSKTKIKLSLFKLLNRGKKMQSLCIGRLHP
uniref:Pyrin domain-containing protein n=1 Tax=Seriola lalandi dorsalis TaxID=1841481 RepID=A0A3B4YD60_SERLL